VRRPASRLLDKSADGTPETVEGSLERRAASAGNFITEYGVSLIERATIQERMRAGLERARPNPALRRTRIQIGINASRTRAWIIDNIHVGTSCEYRGLASRRTLAVQLTSVGPDPYALPRADE
jgi:hypothetical protein